MKYRLPYHVVELRPWPITSAIRAIFIALGLINLFHSNSSTLFLLGRFSISLSMFQWWRDVVREATYIGKHTSYVQIGLKLGVILFIIREVCFFSTFFWAFFHNRLSPSVEIGCSKPPIGISTSNPLRIPLLNTIILLSSGFTVTWSHHCLLSKKRIKTSITLVFTIILGIYFTFLQTTEYINSTFTIADSIYGSIFFVATGFHGIHVVIGTLFLIITLLRNIKTHFSNNHHLRFEIAAWYWHFVDLVCIFLYVCIYWWGSL